MTKSTIRGEAFGRLFAIIEKACLHGSALSYVNLCAQYSNFQLGGAYLHAMVDTAQRGIGCVAHQDAGLANYLSAELDAALRSLCDSVGGDAVDAARLLTMEEKSAYHFGYAAASAKYRRAEAA